MRLCRRPALILVSAVIAAAGCGPRSLGNFRVTYYWIAEEGIHPGPKTEVIHGLPGKYTAGFKKALEMEGTGRLERGVVVNDTGGGVFGIVKARWGLGCRGQPLVPYRSMATDPGVIPTGSVVFIPAFRRVLCPDGTTHDGIFWADDVGKAIRGSHIDVFIGEKVSGGTFQLRSAQPKSGGDSFPGDSVEVYLVRDRTAPPGDGPERERDDGRSKSDGVTK